MTECLEFTCSYCGDYEIEYVEKSAKTVTVPVDGEVFYRLEGERRYFKVLSLREAAQTKRQSGYNDQATATVSLESGEGEGE